MANMHTFGYFSYKVTISKSMRSLPMLTSHLPIPCTMYAALPFNAATFNFFYIGQKMVNVVFFHFTTPILWGRPPFLADSVSRRFNITCVSQV